MFVLQLYFDFISFSQFAAISNGIKTGEVIFQVIHLPHNITCPHVYFILAATTKLLDENQHSSSWGYFLHVIPSRDSRVIYSNPFLPHESVTFLSL